MNEAKPPVIAEASSFLKRWSTTFKMVGVAVLILLLLIPLSMVQSVLRERLGRRNEAVADITRAGAATRSLWARCSSCLTATAAKSWKEQAGAGGKIEKVEVVDLVTANAYFLPTN